MTTLFNIGDKIKLTMIGTIRSFSIDKNGDCYVIDLKNTKGEAFTSVYLEGKALLASNAELVGDKNEI